MPALRSVRLTFLEEGPRTLAFGNNVETGSDLISLICDTLGAPWLQSEVWLRGCGGCVAPAATLPQEELTASLRARGGKGGFGSMLRAIGAQIEKTTNKEACRDLSGRRLRDINREKTLQEQLEKRAARERERLEAKKKKFEKLTQEPNRHVMEDDSFKKEQEALEDSIYSSVVKGLASASSSTPTSTAASTSASGSSGSDSPGQPPRAGKSRRRSDCSAGKPARKRCRFDDDLLDSSSEEE